MDSYILGLNLGRVDPSATLFKNSNILAHVEEERFTRVKKGIAQFPINSIKYCLSLVPGGLNNIVAINLGFDHHQFTYEVPLYYIQEWMDYPSKPKEAGLYEINRLREKHPERICAKIKLELTNAMLVSDYFPPINFYTHHYCHALSSHLASPYENSLGIVIDANSELDTVSVWDCQGTNLTKIYSKSLPHSLGWLYRAFTLFCGFDAYEGEGMLMGLAPYGKPSQELSEKVAQILRWKEDEYGEFEFDIDSTFIYLDKRSMENPALTQKLIDVFGKPCPEKVETPSQYYKDVAYAVQDRFEQTLLRFCERFLTKTGHQYLTLSGGVFLNCKITGYIWKKLPNLNDIYVISTSGDDGIGIGANMSYAVEHLTQKREDYKLANVYLGPEYSNEQIMCAIQSFNIRTSFKTSAQYDSLARTLAISDGLSLEKLKEVNSYSKINSLVSKHLSTIQYDDNITTIIASKLAEGKIIAWFQDRMEAGPRSLGSRSILADPRRMESLLKVNSKIKFRQPWRPFCPTVMDEHKHLYFYKATQSPYMINTFDCTPLTKEKAPAIVHIDGTARPQFLTKEHQPLFHCLLEKFYELTDVPILMNTSMNIKGEPICCTPEDALNFYFATDVDILVLGNYFIEKQISCVKSNINKELFQVC